ncbi:GTPase ObgE [bacterium]|nr:GTPase ObgE [bacterium]
MSQFTDTATLKTRSGNGGAGCSSFRREKYIPKGGPDGGDGGSGGSIVFKTSSQLRSLVDFKLSNKQWVAKDGKQGQTKKRSGLNGVDLIIYVPVGTRVYDENNELIVDLIDDNMAYVIAKGGKGGKGNSHFSTSSNRAPTYAQSGLSGEEKTLYLELRLIAEVGLVGLPNAGKSSLLKCLTKASVKIGSYPFTTLFPNLGTLRTHDKELILADIPGIIKGASQGKGLGHDFLRHIDRTKVLVHLIESSETVEACWAQYETVLHELKQSPYQLLTKPSVLLLSKCDLIPHETQVAICEYFKEQKLDLHPISSFTNDGISSLISVILQLTEHS